MLIILMATICLASGLCAVGATGHLVPSKNRNGGTPAAVVNKWARLRYDDWDGVPWSSNNRQTKEAINLYSTRVHRAVSHNSCHSVRVFCL